MFKNLFAKLKYKFKDKKLTTAYFNNNLPNQIFTKADAESLTNFLKKLDKEYTTEEFIDWLKYTNQEEKFELSSKLVALLNSYLSYELIMTKSITNFVVTKIGENLSKELSDALCKFGDDNLSTMQWTVEYYKYIIRALDKHSN